MGNDKNNILSKLREQEPDPNGGTENARCIIAVDSHGKVILIEITNYDTAYVYLIDQIEEYLDFEGYELDKNIGPGVYLVDVVMESTTDYFGEHDCWLEFHNVKEYKLETFEKEDKK